MSNPRPLALPPASTQLEIDLATYWNPNRKWTAEIEGSRDNKFGDIPEDYLPWLVYEYGVGELLPYLPDPRQAISEGVKWQRKRGTPGALLTALGWVNITANIEQEPITDAHWNWYQLELSRIAYEAGDRDNIENLARLSQPVRSKFVRAFYNHDLRPFRWSDHKWGGPYLYSDWSGVALYDGGPVWSFGLVHANEVDLGGLPNSEAVIEASRYSEAWGETNLRYHRVKYGQEQLYQAYGWALLNNPQAEAAVNPGTWPPEWEEGWGETFPYTHNYVDTAGTQNLADYSEPTIAEARYTLGSVSNAAWAGFDNAIQFADGAATTDRAYVWVDPWELEDYEVSFLIEMDDGSEPVFGTDFDIRVFSQNTPGMTPNSTQMIDMGDNVYAFRAAITSTLNGAGGHFGILRQVADHSMKGFKVTAFQVQKVADGVDSYVQTTGIPVTP